MRVRIFGTHDEATIAQIERCVAAGGERGVLCADGHKGYAQPIGGVVAYRDRISISGVGFDIACGNLAIRTDAKAQDVMPKIGAVMDDVVSDISFGIGRHNKQRIEHELFDDPLWDEQPFKSFKPMAEAQLGTVGSGNHYVDVFLDEDDTVWVGVHFGSRGLGHKTATHFLKKAGGKDGMDVDPAVVSESDPVGQAYIAGMKLAGRYAYAGREYVARHVVQKILGAKIEEEVHNHHNFAWEEEHDGSKYWVVRKGATPAFPGKKGFVGGSMGDDAVIIEGVDSEASREAMFSTVHGAGRVMSRTAAKGKFVLEDGKRIRKEGLVRHDEMMKWLHERGVTLRGGDLDEAPQAYRRLPEVLAAHEGTIRVLHVLKPIGVAMAGRDIRDPYKD
ncbi:RNA-splicing ligase RtcB [Spartobacteria bacterium LR76]|nr:RNA-splicing ligase RtcB [Spartobacteria bacterium LR76]